MLLFLQGTMKCREYTLDSGIKIFLGKNAENNDELMKEYKGKENIILHTVKPGSPFCVIAKLNPTKQEIQEAAIICASKSQDYRDNKAGVSLHQFTGKDIKKSFWMKAGSWKLKNKPKVIKVKKQDIKIK